VSGGGRDPAGLWPPPSNTQATAWWFTRPAETEEVGVGAAAQRLQTLDHIREFSTGIVFALPLFPPSLASDVRMPFDASDKRRVRLAAWHSAYDGAYVERIKLPGAATPSVN